MKIPRLHERQHSGLRLVATLLATAIACGENPLGTVWPGNSGTRITPELKFFDNWGSVLHAGGTLAIRGATVDETFQVAPEHRVPVVVTTTSGDVEHVDLERDVCGSSRSCSGFSVGLLAGATWDKVLASMATYPHGGFSEQQSRTLLLPARVTHTLSVGGTSAWGTGYVWRAADLEQVMAKLRRVEGVRYVEQTGYGCFSICPPWHSYLAAYRPLDERAPTAQNGWIEALPGDSITISYTQPSGAILRQSVLMKAQ